MEKEEVIKRLHSLAPWQNQVEFTADEWERYIELAQLVQATDPDTVEAALDEFVRQVSQQPFTEYEGDSKPFILMRVVFELPERASADERRSFKGWVNWPDADANNQVNLSWQAVNDSGLKGYRIYRNGAALKDVLSPATSTTDAVSATTAYTYQVAAFDNANNVSSLSAAASATTPACTTTTTTPGSFAHALGGTDSDSASAVGIDSAGDVFVAGTFRGSMTVGSTTLTTSGNADWFVVKYTAAGALVWAKHLGGASDDVVTAIAVAPDGSMILAGRFSGTASFGGSQFVANGTSDIALVKLSATGAHVWSKSFGGAYDDEASAVALDSTGNVYITGFFRGTINFGGANLSVPYTSDLDVYIANYADWAYERDKDS